MLKSVRRVSFRSLHTFRNLDVVHAAEVAGRAAAPPRSHLFRKYYVEEIANVDYSYTEEAKIHRRVTPRHLLLPCSSIARDDKMPRTFSVLQDVCLPPQAAMSVLVSYSSSRTGSCCGLADPDCSNVLKKKKCHRPSLSRCHH